MWKTSKALCPTSITHRTSILVSKGLRKGANSDPLAEYGQIPSWNSLIGDKQWEKQCFARRDSENSPKSYGLKDQRHIL